MKCEGIRTVFLQREALAVTTSIGDIAMDKILGKEGSVGAIAVRKHEQRQRVFSIPMIALSERLDTVYRVTRMLCDASGIVDCFW